jgi:hypothetical protein
MLGKKGIADGYRLENYTPTAGKPSILFTVIFGAELGKYENYLRRTDVKLVKEVAGTSIYIQSLNP